MLDRTTTCRAAALALLAALPCAQTATEDARFVGTFDPSGDHFGLTVDLSGDLAIVGAPRDGEAGPKSGAAYVYARQADGSWALDGKLIGSGTNAWDHLGSGVAIDGARALVGAESQEEGGNHNGYAYLFERQADGAWLEVTRFAPPQPPTGEHFGHAVDLDGDRAVVGAYGAKDADGGGWGEGAVYVYDRAPDGSWPEVARLEVPIWDGLMYFGWSVAVEGDRLLAGVPLGAPHDDGSALLFERQPDGAWALVATLEPPPGAVTDNLGAAVALDGDVAVVGGPGPGLNWWGPSGGWSGAIPGSAFVFERQPDGSWPFVTELLSVAPENGAMFGISVAADGGRIAIGAPYTTYAGASNAGRVEVFVRGPGDVWAPETVARASDAALGRMFGVSAALDAGHFVVGAGTSPNTVEHAAYATELASLLHGPTQLSVSAPGSQDLLLRAGKEQGYRPYLLLGSLSGTSPGVVDPSGSGIALPLAPDAYYRLALAGAAPIAPATGVLDGLGATDAAVALPVAAPQLAGLVAHHAYVTFDVETGGVAFASNAVPLELVP